MSLVTGLFLFVAGFAMIYGARPKIEKSSWVAEFSFLGEMYAVAATSFIVLGFCIAALS